LEQDAAVEEQNQIDRELIARVANGQQEALGQLYDRYAPVMLAIGLRMLRDRDEAEDMVQDVFVEVWKRAGDYDARRGRVKTWLCLRARSRSLDRIKSPRLARRSSLDQTDRGPGPTTVNAGPGQVDGQRVRSAVDALPADQREVLVLGYFEGLSSSEIATRLDIPMGTVKSRTRAGLQQLRRQVNDEEALI
jgi:RNA polymerase sigma-70 factor (ECF subfamily)